MADFIRGPNGRIFRSGKDVDFREMAASDKEWTGTLVAAVCVSGVIAYLGLIIYAIVILDGSLFLLAFWSVAILPVLVPFQLALAHLAHLLESGCFALRPFSVTRYTVILSVLSLGIWPIFRGLLSLMDPSLTEMATTFWVAYAIPCIIFCAAAAKIGQRPSSRR